MARKTVRERAIELGGEVAKAAAIGWAGKVLGWAIAAVVAGVAVLILSGSSVPAWAALLVLMVVLAVAVVLIGQQYRRAADAEEELGRGEQYSGIVQDALDALQRVVSGDVATRVDPFVEQAVLEPALRLLAGKPVEELRLSVLIPTAGEAGRWSMRWAAGHSLVGREKYDQPIAATMARYAFERREPQYWGDVEAQADFRQNPLASAATRSLVSSRS